MAEHVPEDAFVRSLTFLGIRGGRRVWTDGSGKHARYYTWDGLHDEVEVYNSRGKHLGSVDPVTRGFRKDAVKGRTLEL